MSDASIPGAGRCFIGIDAGATLCKIAIAFDDGAPRFEVMRSSDVEPIADFVRHLSVSQLTLTGGGSAALAKTLCDAHTINEYAAWHAGSRALTQTFDAVQSEPFLLASIGSGTLLLRVDGAAIHRIGGISLGGATLIGLGSVLAGTSDFAELCRLAQVGDRTRVDLFVEDVYPSGGFNTPGRITAASFGKLARPQNVADPGSPADRIASLMRMLGETIGQICAAQGSIHGTRNIVFGGSTLIDNPALRGALTATLMFNGQRAHFPENAQFTGAVGALLHAQSMVSK